MALWDLCGKLYRPAQNILEEIAETLATLGLLWGEDRYGSLGFVWETVSTGTEYS
jgi:hypothetical protein